MLARPVGLATMSSLGHRLCHHEAPQGSRAVPAHRARAIGHVRPTTATRVRTRVGHRHIEATPLVAALDTLYASRAGHG